MSAAHPLPMNSSRSAGRTRRDVMTCPEGRIDYLTCLLTSFVISNMLTVPLPPKTAFSAASALILRRFFLSWRFRFLMYCHSFFVTSVRGMALVPTTALSAALGVIGFMNAAEGFRLPAFFFAGFLAAFFFAIETSPVEGPNETAGGRKYCREEKVSIFPLGTIGNFP